MLKLEGSFRPLAGIMVLIGFTTKSQRYSRGTSFRPLAGIMVLIEIMDKCNVEIPFGGFRPLAGIMVLIKERDKWVDENEFKFPSPCGDYGSYHVDLEP